MTLDQFYLTIYIRNYSCFITFCFYNGESHRIFQKEIENNSVKVWTLKSCPEILGYNSVVFRYYQMFTLMDVRQEVGV
jgi:hypothetical protein